MEVILFIVVAIICYLVSDMIHEMGHVVWFAQHGRSLIGVSPKSALIVGSLQPMTRVPIVRRNLKEVGWQTSGLTDRNHI